MRHRWHKTIPPNGVNETQMAQDERGQRVAATASAPIRILVADDHPIVREGLVAILSTQPDFQVIGQAGSGAEVVENVTRDRPDVLLLDLEMPDMDGVEALRRLRESAMQVRVIVF